MPTDSIKHTDSLERDLNRREIAAARNIGLAGMASSCLRAFLRTVAALAAARDLLRRQARAAGVDYAAG